MGYLQEFEGICGHAWLDRQICCDDEGRIAKAWSLVFIRSVGLSVCPRNFVLLREQLFRRLCLLFFLSSKPRCRCVLLLCPVFIFSSFFFFLPFLLQKSFPLLLAWVWKHLCTFLASSSDLLWWWRKLCKSSIVSVQSFGLSVCLFMSWNFLYVFVVCCVLVVDGSCTSVFCSLFTLQFKTSGKKYCGVALVMTYDSKASGFFLDLLSSCVCVCVCFLGSW